jgi:enamine deaminase RidA (YjgF/YER057c/UK114 family)
MTKQVLLPTGWKRPKGYSNGIAASGKYVFTAGVIGWNAEEVFDAKNSADQFRQVLVNTRDILREAGAAPADIVRMTCYITDRQEYLDSAKEIGAAWRDIFGKTYPCMAVVQVVALVETEAKVEIETTAVIPDTA